MKSLPIAPLAGIDNFSPRDDALQVGGREPRVYLRDANNITIENGRASMRPGLRPVTNTPYADLWQSPLHGDTFARLGAQWVKVNTANWSHEVLAEVGEGALFHLVLNGVVLVAGPAGIFQYDGRSALPFTLSAPAAPVVTASAGSLEAGDYGVAVAWLRGALESPLSPMTTHTAAASGGMQVLLPAVLDPTVTGVRMYLTRHNGGELLRGEDYPVSATMVNLPTLPKLGAPAQFRHMEPMPTGQYLGQWRGRLVVAQGRTLRFSEAMAYHVHDPRHGFVQMPQRITFVAPVDGGLWVGQVDHVVFLRGAAPQELAFERKTSRAPVPGSTVALTSDEAGEASGGARAAVAWLSSAGFAMGTPDGGIIEPQAQRLRAISATAGSTVVQHHRLTTALR